MLNFASLHNHTSFSLMRSIVKPIDLFTRAKELGHQAIAVTDYASMAGMWDCLSASRETGIKFIPGCEFNFVNDISNEAERFRSIVLLAKNAEGYKNLLSLGKSGFDNATIMFKKVQPRIDWKLLEDHKDGLICLTGDGNGVIAQLLMGKRFDTAKTQIKRLHEIFGESFALEFQPHDLTRRRSPYSGEIDQRFINKKLKELGSSLDIRCVVTNDAYYELKDHHRAHDVVLAIGSGQPKASGNRLTFGVDEFHVKSALEIAHYFVRKKHQYDPDFIKSLFDNSILLADMCEDPDWIDPKFSNPSGKELPEFPVNQQIDYDEFLGWKKRYKDNKLPDDVLYLRYRCERGFAKKVPKGKEKEYRERLDEELDVLESKNFSSYMLIVMDYVQHAKRNGIPVGPGRGCLTGDSLVFTNCGLKRLESIAKGDKVYTHNGNIKKVLNTLKYNVEQEWLIKVKTQWSCGEISMTKDHKVFGAKDLDSAPQWIEINKLNKGNYIYMPFPKRRIIPIKNIDLSNYLDKMTYPDKLWFDDNFVYEKHYNHNALSIRSISKDSGVYYDFVRKLKYNIKTSNLILRNKVESILNKRGLTIEDWRKIENFSIKKYNRFITIDENFTYFLGRWVGDGSFHGKTRGITISFNKNDYNGIRKIRSYVNDLGFSCQEYAASSSQGFNLTISSQLLYLLISDLFPEYYSCYTKHLPVCFRRLNNDSLKALLLGCLESDGTDAGLDKIKTTSARLAKELKEALLYLKIPAGICLEKNPSRYDKKTKPSFTISFMGIRRNRKINRGLISPKGYYSKILNINNNSDKYVYDLTVQDDHSYLTSNYAVHNSVGGCLIAYLLNIHIVDPIKYGLIFARFQNKEKSAEPDIDLDFATAGRDNVVHYVRQKYGEDYVAHVSNVNTITPKVYARDISRTFEFGDAGRSESAAIGDDIADSIFADTKTVEKALADCPLFAEYAKEEYPELAEFADTVGGVARAWSTHAGGIVIGKRSLVGLVPLRKDKDGTLALEYEKERAEENGLVKMDILGLTTLDIISDTYRVIKEVGKPLPPNPPDFEVYDKETYDLISRGDTFCVFQLTGVAAPVCKMLKPKSVKEIALITALIRPAAKAIIEDFMKVRSGQQELKLIHPSLERALSGTYGFGLYEECLMYIASDVAGWDLHKADGLRKMTKAKGKHPKKVKALRKEFIQDAQAFAKTDEYTATRIWDEIISDFGGYGFNLPHAIFYSILSFYTAYLKAHYPLEFLVANLMFEVKSNSPKAKGNILRIKDEIRALGVKIVAPDINKSETTYKIINSSMLMTGLDSMKYMGKDAIPEILAKRPFTSFRDFIERIDKTKVRAPAIMALAACGCLDSFGISRKLMFLYAKDYKDKLKVYLKKPEDTRGDFNYPWPKDENEWSPRELFGLEAYYMGEGLSGTISERYEGFFDSGVVPLEKLTEVFPYRKRSDDEKENRRKNSHYLNGRSRINSLKSVVTSIFSFKVKKEGSKLLGQEMARITVQDPWANELNIVAFPERWEYIRDRAATEFGSKSKFEEGVAISFDGVFQYENEHTQSFIINDILDFRPAPGLPDDLKSRKVKMPRSPRKKDVKKLNKETLAEELEDELVEDGIDSVYDEDEDWIDPFK